MIGKEFTIEITVTENDTAKSVGSGELSVFATPRMCALMEESAYKCVANDIGEGNSTVGTMLNINHVSATPVGMKVRAVAKVTAVDGRKISFELKAYDECGLIGEGTHDRFIVPSEKFMSKTNAKLIR